MIGAVKNEWAQVDCDCREKKKRKIVTDVFFGGMKRRLATQWCTKGRAGGSPRLEGVFTSVKQLFFEMKPQIFSPSFVIACSSHNFFLGMKSCLGVNPSHQKNTKNNIKRE